MMKSIGNLRESSLHKALKLHYSKPGDLQEEILKNYIVDIRSPEEIIEIQTGSFSKIRNKIADLLTEHPLRVVLPIALNRHIVRIDNNGRVLSKRLSPKKGRIEDIFLHLVGIAPYAAHANFILEVPLVHDEIYWMNDGRGSWRRKKWSVHDRVLIDIIDTVVFMPTEKYLELLPFDSNEIFSSSSLSSTLNISSRLSNKMLYCLRSMNLIRVIGLKGRAYLYQRNL